jgi:hypothetical protein
MSKFTQDLRSSLHQEQTSTQAREGASRNATIVDDDDRHV